MLCTLTIFLNWNDFYWVMDRAWQKVFNENAERNIPDYQASCWTKNGYEERLKLFPFLLESAQSLLHRKGFPALRSALDVGCGPGEYCRLLAKKGFVVTGVDYADNMLLRAKKHTQTHISYCKANAYDLPFGDASFDLVISIGALQCVEHHERFVRELCRTARCAVIISTLRTTSKTDPAVRLQNLLRYDSWPTRTYHPDVFVELFRQEGFSPVVKLKNADGDILSDSFFIVALRNKFISDVSH